MYLKIVYFSFILLEFLCRISAECDVKRVARSSDDSADRLKFYVECPAAADPMVSMASENEPIQLNSKLGKLLKLPEIKKPSIKNPLFAKNAIHLDKINIPDVNTKPEMPTLNFNDLKNIRSPLSDLLSKLPKPKINIPPQNAPNFAEASEQISNNLRNLLDGPQPNGRFNSALRDLILARRKNQDLSPSPSDIIANKEPEEFEEQEPEPELSLTEKLKVMAEKQRKALEEKIAAAKMKLPNLKGLRNVDDTEEGASNDIVSQALPEENSGLQNALSEKARVLREKIISPLKRNLEKEQSIFPKMNAKQSLPNTDISQIEPKPSRLDNLAEKTKTIARKLKKLIDLDIEEDRDGVMRSKDQKELVRSDLAPKFQPIQESERNAVAEKNLPLADKLKKIMSQNPQRAVSTLAKRQKDDPIISASNPEVISDSTADKLSIPKTKMAERVQIIADRIKNAIQSASDVSKMRSSNDLDSEVDNSNVEEVVAEAPEDLEEDMEGAKSDAVVQEVPNDDIIDLTKEGSKSADICKCIRVAFPEKFENGHFVMGSKSDDAVTSPSENEDEISLIPKFNKIAGNSKLGSKLKNIFRSRGDDLATMADESRPAFARAPAGLETELSQVERAKMADQGIRSLLEFVKIVDQVDQYITTKARRAISRLATVLSEDEDARLL